ncbi:MAG: pantoate--beta-alanine ligase [Mycobacterium sp.]|nr:pantoate--beta-alanine ligase [Mycobacterium sp.]
MTTSLDTFTVYREPAALTTAVRDLRAAGRRVGLVPTMGALHDGHLSLVRRLRHTTDAVVASVFVNPLQFGPGEDLDSYPRTWDSDVALLRETGVTAVFAPSVADMYPEGQRTTVQPGPLGAELEGASRPGHFAGMLTVVAKLLQICQPDRACFGEKDYQQLVLIRQLVRDLNFPVQIVGGEIVRDPDGVASSSRNRYLTPAQRTTARALYSALTAGARAGRGGAEKVLAAARETLANTAGLEVDYVALRTPDLLAKPSWGPARLLVAARIGNTRLIDNIAVSLGEAQEGGN